MFLVVVTMFTGVTVLLIIAVYCVTAPLVRERYGVAELRPYFMLTACTVTGLSVVFFNPVFNSL